ncbi:DUF262 domain-containing protein [Sulfurospirillum barnesii]|uniref:GmrSD restriction endonucleases N-terminal domain-containing protein n=1 Tax=Sulfurospirillum barnesii (strain ATCC 700032 / DSM 10660 / SES-3) TaxID=760154 RepID=I3XW14_SULBS|nr:DUF262 domain-containing protein [Sulfurospirillum barnesii]AFL68138.1 hypothetical protein Sulba_0836 [Sulfurospirillum barnesii SES-3]
METFKTDTYTIRQLLKNETDENDRGKNYFIPPYQRKYDWDQEQVEKLIDDIFEQVNKKTEQGYKPYFIGGVVLSQQSILGDERSKKSLEVIDGQQRLTTIVLILASIVQLLKFQDRQFENKKDVSEHLINDISKILKIKTLNLSTMNVEEKYILERSDALSTDFQKTINFLIETKITDKIDLKKIITNNEDSEKLINLVFIIKEKIEIFDDNELTDFTLQLLNSTWLVVTKTISIETGFFIFEKLNDSGIALEPQDLLKNYFFRTSTESEYNQLTEKWKLFLTTVTNINSSKAKILPRDFLEQYLTIIGDAKDTKTHSSNGKIFKQFKSIQQSDFTKSIELLEHLIKIATEYGKLKRNDSIAQYLNVMNFKLGYLIVLSFYKRFDDEYLNYKNDILLIVVKLGLVYLVTGQSKELSVVIPNLCYEIINKGKDIQDTLVIANSYINGLISKKKDTFDEVVSSTNLWRKKPLTRLLLSILEFHVGGNKLPNYFNLFQIMPQEYSSEFQYDEIDEDNCNKYANYIGNILIDKDSKYADIDDNNFKERYKNDSDVILNNLDKKIVIKDKEIDFLTETNNLSWGKNRIIERSQTLTELAKHVIINDNFNKDFFKDIDKK